MKIAALTDDGETLSADYPGARYYLVLTVIDGKITSQERRDKMICGSHAHNHDDHNDHNDHDDHDAPVTVLPPAGTWASIPPHHQQMIAPIADCRAVLARGFRPPIYADLQRAGVYPILTAVTDIATAALDYSAGRLDIVPGLTLPTDR